MLFSKPLNKTNKINIGLIAPLSGSSADFGTEELKGINLALLESDIANKINIIAEDSANDPIKALSSFKKLIEIDKIDYLFGSMSSSGLVLRDEINKSQILSFWIAAHPNLLKDNKYIIRNIATINNEINLIVNYLKEKDINNCSVFYINDDFGTAARDSFVNNYNGDILEIQSYNKNSNDFKSEIIKVISKNPKALFIAGYGVETGILLRQIKELKYSGKIFGTIEISASNTKLSAKDAIDGVIYTGYNISNTFRDKCKEQMGVEVTPNIFMGYIQTKILLEAIESTDGSKEKVREYILNKDKYDFGFGEIYLEDYEIIYPLELKELKYN
ncbi:MAG: ABC transporter substrate-binding protein [archaeon]